MPIYLPVCLQRRIRRYFETYFIVPSIAYLTCNRFRLRQPAFLIYMLAWNLVCTNHWKRTFLQKVKSYRLKHKKFWITLSRCFHSSITKNVFCNNVEKKYINIFRKIFFSQKRAVLQPTNHIEKEKKERLCSFFNFISKYFF